LGTERIGSSGEKGVKEEGKERGKKGKEGGESADPQGGRMEEEEDREGFIVCYSSKRALLVAWAKER